MIYMFLSNNPSSGDINSSNLSSSYQWPDNVKSNKNAKFDKNIPCGSRVNSIFTN